MVRLKMVLSPSPPPHTWYCHTHYVFWGKLKVILEENTLFASVLVPLFLTMYNSASNWKPVMVQTLLYLWSHRSNMDVKQYKGTESWQHLQQSPHQPSFSNYILHDWKAKQYKRACAQNRHFKTFGFLRWDLNTSDTIHVSACACTYITIMNLLFLRMSY